MKGVRARRQPDQVKRYQHAGRRLGQCRIADFIALRIDEGRFCGERLLRRRRTYQRGGAQQTDDDPIHDCLLAAEDQSDNFTIYIMK